MKLIVDSGSTKTDFCVIDGAVVVERGHCQGINPFQQDVDVIDAIVSGEIVSQLSAADEITDVFFYGAGCREETQPVMTGLLARRFRGAGRVEVCSDLLAAARALFHGREGVACILGTGSNSCLYDGCGVLSNVSPLGYVLGDEGSGAVLGRLFVNALFKGGLPDSLREKFLRDSGLTLSDIINKVYRQPLANRFLASLSVYVREYIDFEEVNAIVVGNFRDFFRKNVALYGRHDLPVAAVGGIAYHYERQLCEAAEAEGYRLERVIKSPMSGLIEYHSAV